MTTNSGSSVAEISTNRKVLLIFLRHLACIFCREALKDIHKIQANLNKQSTDVVFVHMADSQVADEVFEGYNLSHIQHISDVNKEHYKAFGLVKGDFRQLFGFKSFFGMGRATLKGNRAGSNVIGDPHQMPGVFLIKDSKVINYFIYNSVGDYPDYMKIVKNGK